MKILIKSTANLTNYYVHAYETWKLALARFADVKYYGEGYDGFIGWDVDDEVVYRHLDFTPDVELWCGGPGNAKPQYIDSKFILNNPVKSIPKLILSADFWEIKRDASISRWRKREVELQAMGVVGYFSFYTQAEPWLINVAKSTMEHFVSFPYIYDEIFAELQPKKKWDVCNQGAINKDYPLRMKVQKKLAKHPSIETFSIQNKNKYQILDKGMDPLEEYFHGGSPASNYAHLLNSCWITFTDGYTKYTRQKWSFRLDGTDLFLAKYPQALASQSVLFCPKITSTHINHIEDGVHYVEIDKRNFVDKMEYYLANKEKLEEIARNATLWAADNCSTDVVGKRLNDDLSIIIS